MIIYTMSRSERPSTSLFVMSYFKTDMPPIPGDLLEVNNTEAPVIAIKDP